MRPAPVRRLALMAAMMLLGAAWWRPALGAEPIGLRPPAGAGIVSTGAEPAAPAPGTTPALHRSVTGGWWAQGTRSDHGRGLLALACLASLVLLPAARFAAGTTAWWAAPTLGRRRHVISLRAPPTPLGA